MRDRHFPRLCRSCRGTDGPPGGHVLALRHSVGGRRWAANDAAGDRRRRAQTGCGQAPAQDRRGLPDRTCRGRRAPGCGPQDERGRQLRLRGGCSAPRCALTVLQDTPVGAWMPGENRSSPGPWAGGRRTLERELERAALEPRAGPPLRPGQISPVRTQRGRVPRASIPRRRQRADQESGPAAPGAAAGPTAPALLLQLVPDDLP